MLHQPVRLGGLALLCALATSALVLVAFLASTLVLSVVGGLGGLAGGDVAGSGDSPETAVLLSTEQDSDERCDRGRDRARVERDPARDRLRDAGHCAERRTSSGAGRP